MCNFRVVAAAVSGATSKQIMVHLTQKANSSGVDMRGLVITGERVVQRLADRKEAKAKEIQRKKKNNSIHSIM